MRQKRTSGLLNRKRIWHIDKKILGQRLYESTGSDFLEETEIYLTKRTEEIRQAKIYDVRPKQTFRQAATKYLEENRHKASIKEDASWLSHLDPFIGHLPLESISYDNATRLYSKKEKVKSKNADSQLPTANCSTYFEFIR